jgi:hypothetical protein
MAENTSILTEDAKKRMMKARALIDQGKIELQKARQAGLTEVVAKMEPEIKAADARLRQLESVYR